MEFNDEIEVESEDEEEEPEEVHRPFWFGDEGSGEISTWNMNVLMI